MKKRDLTRPRRHLAALICASLVASLLAVGITATVAPAPTAQAAPGEPSEAQCPSKGTLIQNTQAYEVNIATGQSTLRNTYSLSLNALGFNKLDGYYYALGGNGGANRTVVAFSADHGAEVNLGPVVLPGVGTFANVGEITPDGIWYVMENSNNSGWAAIDVRPGSETYLEVVDSGVVSYPPEAVDGIAHLGADWTYNVNDGALYRVAIGGNPTVAYLLKFDPETGEASRAASLGRLLAPDGRSITANGAVWADDSGYLYVSSNGNGTIFRVNMNAPYDSTFFAYGPASSLNDGGRCISALPLDFGDAPASYGTLAAANGARHNTQQFDEANGRSPLMLGTTIDAETDGQVSAAADGDDAGNRDDEDGVARPIVVFPGRASTVQVSVTNDSTTAATLAGWIDLNGNGTFEDSERSILPVPASSGTAEYTLSFPAGTVDRSTFARFRLFSGTVANPSPIGPASDGEVEDYPTVLETRELTVEKTSDRTADSRAGDTINYTVTATNTGTGDYTAGEPATIIDDLTGVLDDATFDGSVNASVGAATYTEPRIRWQGPLGSGDEVVLTYSVVLTGAGDRSVDNVAFVADCVVGEDCVPVTPPLTECIDGGTDPVTGLACDAVSYGLPNLTVDKTADTTVVSEDGQSVIYTVTATNNGTAAYTTDRPAVVLDDLSGVLDDATLDESTLAADVGDAPAFAEPLIRWSGPLGIDKTVKITYTVTFDAQAADGDGSLKNVAFAPTCDAADPTCESGPPTTPECDPADENGLDPATGMPCARVEIPTVLLDVEKTSDPADGATVQVGDDIAYTITFSNTGSAAADVNDWTDHLAEVVDDATVTVQPRSSSASLVVSPIEDEQFSINGTVPSDESITVTYTVTVKPDGERGDDVIGNVVTPPGVDPPTECAADDELCTKHFVPEVVASKSVDPASGSTVDAGQTLTYTLTFANTGAVAGSISEVDDLSQLVDDAEVTTVPVASDDALTVSAIADDQFTIEGTLQAGQTVTVTYQVTVLPDGDRGDDIVSNFLLPEGTDPRKVPECAADDPRCTKNPVPEIIDSKSSSPASGSTVLSGDVITYTLTFRNDGAAAGNVDKADDLTHVLDDADLTAPPMSSDPALTVTDVQEGRFAVVGTLQPNQEVTVTYQVTVRPDAERGDNTLANYLLQPDSTPPTNPVCKDDDQDCTVHLVPLIVGSKSADPAPGSSVYPGQVVTYTLTFENRGAGPGVVDKIDDLTHVLDDGSLVSEPHSSRSTVQVAAVSDTRYGITGTIPAGATVTVTYQVLVSGSGDHVLANYLMPPGGQPPVDPVCEPDAASDIDCTVHPVPEIVISKASDPITGSEVEAGDVITYTLTLRNTGAAEGTVAFTDHLDAVLDDAKLVGQPESDTDSVEAVADGESIVLAGSIATGATITVTYAVEVLEWDQQGDHMLGNFVTATGGEPPTVCVEGSALCTTHTVPEPPPGNLATTGGVIALWMLAAAGLLTVGGGVLVGIRRRREV